ncbi:hypothetical protein NW801_13815 [Brevibacillus laterosporus]|uniref:Uncharacterized protein n=1 Tax=Brevibacillus halotolerans TaxID=1507437 RepID=A0ABT4HYH6_9BACL|nr:MULTISPECIES: hypothetical protein [Brevibacillus]MCR8986101.1 hypothetical protein [Brevibacillus laterosporus]MCZ0831834.1 hypothetical protein [Brevibacillus halotolerans]
MSGNVTVGIQSYKIEQNFEEGKLILDLYFDNPEGDVQKYAKFIDDFETFLKEKGYAIPVVKPTESDIDEVLTKFNKSLEEQIGVYKHA